MHRFDTRITDIPHAGGNFTCLGGLATWTVALAEQAYFYAVELTGKLVEVAFSFLLTSVNIGGGNTAALQVTLPAWIVPAVPAYNQCLLIDNAVRGIGTVNIAAAGTFLSVALIAGGNFAAAVNTTSVTGSIIIRRV